MRIIILSLLGFLLHSKVDGQATDTRFGFKSFTIESKQYGKVEYHVSVDSMDIKKPVLIYLFPSRVSAPAILNKQAGLGATLFSTSIVYCLRLIFLRSTTIGAPSKTFDTIYYKTNPAAVTHSYAPRLRPGS